MHLGVSTVQLPQQVKFESCIIGISISINTCCIVFILLLSWCLFLASRYPLELRKEKTTKAKVIL